MVADFRSQVASIPDQLEHVPEPSGCLPADWGRLILAGMGGSGVAGEFLSLLGGDRETLVVRNSEFPTTPRPDDVLLAISYSGETAETNAVWEQARTLGMTRAAVASGGRLLKVAGDDGVPFCRIPSGMYPRTALGYLLRGAWSVSGLEPEPDWGAVADHLRSIAARWDGSEPEGPNLVSRMRGTVPALLAAEPGLAVAARRWVANLAENAKAPAMIWEFPEASHNQIMAVRAGVPLCWISLGSPAAEGAVRWWNAAMAALEEEGVTVHKAHSPSPDPWTRVLGVAHVGDWVSVLVAEDLKVDPTDLSLMDEIKRRLKER